MEKIIMPKGFGKTHQLIKMSARSGNYIVCHSFEECNRIANEAQKMNLKIPFPATYDELLKHQYYARGINGILIDNVEMFLQHLIKDLPINAITLC